MMWCIPGFEKNDWMRAFKMLLCHIGCRSLRLLTPIRCRDMSRPGFLLCNRSPLRLLLLAPDFCPALPLCGRDSFTGLGAQSPFGSLVC